MRFSSNRLARFSHSFLIVLYYDCNESVGLRSEGRQRNGIFDVLPARKIRREPKNHIAAVRLSSVDNTIDDLKLSIALWKGKETKKKHLSSYKVPISLRRLFSSIDKTYHSKWDTIVFRCIIQQTAWQTAECNINLLTIGFKKHLAY